MWSLFGSILLGFTMGVISTNTVHGGTTLGMITVLAGTGGLAALNEGDQAGFLLTTALIGFLSGAILGLLIKGGINKAHKDNNGDSNGDDSSNGTGSQGSTSKEPPLQQAIQWTQSQANPFTDLIMNATDPSLIGQKPGIFASQSPFIQPDPYDNTEEILEEINRLEGRLDYFARNTPSDKNMSQSSIVPEPDAISNQVAREDIIRTLQGQEIDQAEIYHEAMRTIIEANTIEDIDPLYVEALPFQYEDRDETEE